MIHGDRGAIGAAHLSLPLTGLLAEAAYLKACFYVEYYGSAVARQTAPIENSTTYAAQNSTTYAAKTRPSNQRDMARMVIEIPGRIREEELAKLVKDAGWPCWASKVKLTSLLMLVADAANRMKKGVFSFSSRRLRVLCPTLHSKLVTTYGAPGEGLAVLVAVGVFKPERLGRFYPFARSAEFSFCEQYGKRGTFKIKLSVTSKQAAKWYDRHDRIRDSFERKNPIIAVVRETAGLMKFSAQGMELLRRLPAIEPGKVASAERCYRWLQGPIGKMTLDSSGTLSSPISGCPKIIRPYLLISGEEVTEMDISGAHIALLTRIYEPEFLSLYRIPHTPEEAQEERLSLTAQIQAGDVYAGETKDERDDHKDRMLSDLNRPTGAQMALKATEPLYAGRRIFTNVMWAVKRSDHRNLSHWLRRWTSDMVNPAVLALHERGIPSIPIVDGLMIRKQDAEAARDDLDSRLFASTGIRGKVVEKDLKAKYAALLAPESALAA